MSANFKSQFNFSMNDAVLTFENLPLGCIISQSLLR
jgi:hypothetical protein